jgi:putative transposase
LVLAGAGRTRSQAASSGYLRARRNAAKLHQKAANQNKHAPPIWDKAVVENHQMIAIEDFTTLFLARSTMTGKCADGAIGAAKAR